MKESLRLSPPLTRKWVICYCAFLWCLSQLPVGTSLFFLTCCHHGSFVVDGITHLQSLFICCPAVVSSEYSEYLLNILQINSKIFKVACPNKDCRLLNCDEGRGHNCYSATTWGGSGWWWWCKSVGDMSVPHKRFFKHHSLHWVLLLTTSVPSLA